MNARRSTWRPQPKPYRAPLRFLIPLYVVLVCIATLGAVGIYAAFQTGLAK